MQNSPDKITVAGKQLETVVIGPPIKDGRTIVMLHAGLGAMKLWHDFPQRLSEETGCSILLYSRYGYGGSEPLTEKRSTDYLHHEGQEVLPELLDFFEISQPILFGHSDGGSIALLYAAKFPASPAAVIVEAPHVFVEDITIAGIIETKQHYETGDLRRRLLPHHIDADATFWGWNDIWLDPAFRQWNIEAIIRSIQCPILAIQGKEDQYGTLAQIEAIEKLTPHTESFIVSECRHSPHADQTDLVLARTAEFLTRVGEPLRSS